MTAILTFIKTISCDSCIANAQDFISATHLIENTHDTDLIAIDFALTDDQITEFLNKCRFEPVLQLPTRKHCEKACSVHGPCMAYVFVDDVNARTGCELCVTETRETDVMNLAHAHEEIMIGVKVFEHYMIGNVYYFASFPLSIFVHKQEPKLNENMQFVLLQKNFKRPIWIIVLKPHK